MRQSLKQPQKQPLPVELIRQDPVFRGHLKVDELHIRHGLFSGGMSEQISREVVWRRDAVCVMPYDPRRDEVVLIEQFRASALFNGDRAWMVEVVAGLIEDGESIEEVARRELKEESGLDAIGELLPINTVYSTPVSAASGFTYSARRSMPPVPAASTASTTNMRTSGFSPSPSRRPSPGGKRGKRPILRPPSACSGSRFTGRNCAGNGKTHAACDPDPRRYRM